MGSLKRRLVKTATIAGAVTALVFTASQPAHAHFNQTYNYSCGLFDAQECGFGWVEDSHRSVGACDTRADGEGVYLRYRLANGEGGTVNDSNGAATGCGYKTPGTSSNPVVSFGVCGSWGPWCTPWEAA